MNTLPTMTADLIIVGGTPGGIMAAIAAARLGRSSIILERTRHVGGLPANGLGATDIGTRAATGGLFRDFVDRVKAHYMAVYGATSPQVQMCSDGYHFEPSVGEQVLLAMIAEHTCITVLLDRQFDALPVHLEKTGSTISAVRILDRSTGQTERFVGSVFIDATYEGDLAAAAGCPWRTRRESTAEYGEFAAGRFYRAWGESTPGEGSTGEGDDVIQAYNYRLCLTDRPDNRVAITKPLGYQRDEYVSLADDLVNDRAPGRYRSEREWDGIGRIVNQVSLPNSKTDSNNQHLAFISTDLPEENYHWPTADWAWRDGFAQRLRDYTLGLIWFLQNDAAVPETFRVNASRWGLAKDEYTDNGHFPRQVYVREGRRIEGEYTFISTDALPTASGSRPPIHTSSITASHYAIDSHAVRKREPGRVHLDGFLSVRTEPYTVPYGIMVPRGSENLLTPVPVSATHLGFGTLRMEPCWMALGHAAGIAAGLAIRDRVAVRSVSLRELQDRLIAQGAVLIHYRDVSRDHPAFAVLQRIGLRGGIPEWEARLTDVIAPNEGARWARWCGLHEDLVAGIGLTRGEVLVRLGAALST